MSETIDNGLDYSVSRRNVKYPRIEFKTGNMVVILPESMPSEKSILENKMNWIKAKQEQILRSKHKIQNTIGKNRVVLFGNNYSLKESKEFNLDSRNKIIKFNVSDNLHQAKLKKLLKKRLNEKLMLKSKEYQKGLDVKLGKVMIRNQKTKWGSCSSYGNLSFNLKLAFLPDRLIDYVIFHETLHLKIHNHSSEFWELINAKFGDYLQLEKSLLDYWFFLSQQKFYNA